MISNTNQQPLDDDFSHPGPMLSLVKLTGLLRPNTAEKICTRYYYLPKIYHYNEGFKFIESYLMLSLDSNQFYFFSSYSHLFVQDKVYTSATLKINDTFLSTLALPYPIHSI